jgi:hypothetical protein
MPTAPVGEGNETGGLKGVSQGEGGIGNEGEQEPLLNFVDDSAPMWDQANLQFDSQFAFLASAHGAAHVAPDHVDRAHYHYHSESVQHPTS